MNCRDCARYVEGRCADRKLNPESWSAAVEVANVIGIRAICSFNDHRQKLVESRMPGGNVGVRPSRNLK